MSTEAVSYPFYRISPEVVEASGTWECRRRESPDNSFVLSGNIESWDYQTDLEFRRSLSIDVPKMLENCGFMEGTEIRIQVLVSTSRQRMRWIAHSIDLICQGGSGVEVTELGFELKGERLQGDLRIDTEISVLKAVPSTDDPFIPTAEGSRLWSDSVTAALEGSLSRFPMSSVSFTKAFSDIGNAGWMLHWSPDMVESSASAAMRLYLNEDSKLFQEIVSCDTPVCGLVQSDILRQVLMTFLLDDEFELDPHGWPEHSLGNFAAQWIMNIFRELPGDQIRSRIRSEPGWAEARIQSYVRSDNGN